MRAPDRVASAGAALGLTLDIREFPDGTRTAAEAAAAVGCDVGAIVKSLVFTGDAGAVLALVSGTNRLDPVRLAAAAGTGPLRQANADEVRAATGYAIGGVPPFGHPDPLVTFVDADLTEHPVLWAAAGTPRHVFPIDPAVLVEVTSGTVAGLRAE